MRVALAGATGPIGPGGRVTYPANPPVQASYAARIGERVLVSEDSVASPPVPVQLFTPTGYAPGSQWAVKNVGGSATVQIFGRGVGVEHPHPTGPGAYSSRIQPGGTAAMQLVMGPGAGVTWEMTPSSAGMTMYWMVVQAHKSTNSP